MGRKNRTNCYKILDVARNASKSTIKQAYFRLSKIYHPDKQEDQQNQESIDKATAKFQEIKKAYEEAIDRRERYDKSSVGNRDKGEEEDYDYDQHMYNRYRKQQQADRSSGYSDWYDINVEETESAQEVVVHGEQIDEDEEIERRVQEQVEEYFAYKEMGKAKMNARHHGMLK